MFRRDLHTAPPPARGGLSRREFVKGVAAAAGAALLALGSRLALHGPPAEIPGEALLRSTFAGHVGSAFSVAPEGGPATALRLVQVADLPGAAASDAQREHSFALLFRGAADHPLAQGTYRFERRGLGAFTVFIVPGAPAADGASYEAVFNRLPA